MFEWKSGQSSAVRSDTGRAAAPVRSWVTQRSSIHPFDGQLHDWRSTPPVAGAGSPVTWGEGPSGPSSIRGVCMNRLWPGIARKRWTRVLTLLGTVLAMMCGAAPTTMAATTPPRPIIGGSPVTDAATYPWMAQVQFVHPSGQFRGSCAGSLLDRQWVITAGALHRPEDHHPRPAGHHRLQDHHIGQHRRHPNHPPSWLPGDRPHSVRRGAVATGTARHFHSDDPAHRPAEQPAGALPRARGHCRLGPHERTRKNHPRDAAADHAARGYPLLPLPRHQPQHSCLRPDTEPQGHLLRRLRWTAHAQEPRPA